LLANSRTFLVVGTYELFFEGLLSVEICLRVAFELLNLILDLRRKILAFRDLGAGDSSDGIGSQWGVGHNHLADA